jgi:hypothetical protein
MYAPFNLTDEQKHQKEEVENKIKIGQKIRNDNFIKEHGLINGRSTGYLDGSMIYDCPSTGKQYNILFHGMQTLL